MLVDEVGPACLLESFRCSLGLTRDAEGRPVYREGSVAHLASCFACASAWVALLTVLAVVCVPSSSFVFVALAMSQVANLIDGAT